MVQQPLGCIPARNNGFPSPSERKQRRWTRGYVEGMLWNVLVILAVEIKKQVASTRDILWSLRVSELRKRALTIAGNQMDRPHRIDAGLYSSFSMRPFTWTWRSRPSTMKWESRLARQDLGSAGSSTTHQDIAIARTGPRAKGTSGNAADYVFRLGSDVGRGEDRRRICGNRGRSRDHGIGSRDCDRGSNGSQAK
ncbi:hypothetical protein B0T26DRAFT_671485 [Lasiosphaeria miniovina]|uniref:Uncharacterized protein n=1 Tax=Lasiosphaeria miniovina TaxID=1954250 RepID=A0AA40B2Y2_9PEZI|nr:uncharacterized protein B0T26DRAFT_671485 [Lasiosphaeria miniovina]KAK0726718.1 hypothetical protein B0T26DRAFT_671485 [Lasiosphaeria miniovina]